VGHRSPGGFLGEAALALYGAAGRLAEPLAGALLARRGKGGKEDSERRGERFGRPSCARPLGPLVWVHAASVGETVTSLPLVNRLAKRGVSVLLTTGTVTAAQVAANRLPPSAIHQYVPIDTPGSIARFLDFWRPGLVLFAESELWPTMLTEIRRRGVPLVLINARMSERSFRSWRRLAPLARSVMDRLELCLAQSPSDAERLRALGAPRVVVSGNLKFDVPAPPADESAVAAMRAAVAGRFVFVAASTHAGEETPVIAAHAEVARAGRRLLTILAPRHPERGDALAAEIAHGRAPHRPTLSCATYRGRNDIYLADTIGEMGLWYRLADVAFLGGSMVPRGGQNPIEPAKLQVPVLHGSHVGNFRDVYAALATARAATQVEDSASLSAAIKRLMADPTEREHLGRQGQACVERLSGALDRTLDALEPYIPAPKHDRAAVPGA
jgi:3-deoxy-D-manno-octulosonic-acid transferase